MIDYFELIQNNQFKSVNLKYMIYCEILSGDSIFIL